MKTNLADKWFSRYIRLRASDNGIGKCFTCGRIKEVKEMDCGHYIKRQYSATRYNEINCQVQCKHCNNFLQGNDAKFRENLVTLYGVEKVYLLESSKRHSKKMGKMEQDYIAELYKQKTAELVKEKGKWWK